MVRLKWRWYTNKRFHIRGDVADGCIKCLENELHITTSLGSGEEYLSRE